MVSENHMVTGIRNNGNMIYSRYSNNGYNGKTQGHRKPYTNYCTFYPSMIFMDNHSHIDTLGMKEFEGCQDCQKIPQTASN
jgi:hypothetical protein